MIRVRTGSRLHFGLLNPAAGSGRRFGGVGLMVEAPGLCVRATPAGEWSADGPLAGRALAFAQRFAETVPAATPLCLTVESAPPEHVGLGTGTQLGLAVARAAATVYGLEMNAAELARRVGRGLRSALGTHGFEQGGFLVDAGKRGGETLAPLAARMAFPETWRIVLALPARERGLHGRPEMEAFARLTEESRTDSLCRLVLLGLLPALAETDVTAFGEALYEFNARAGEAFAAAQGGTYAGPRVTELVKFARSLGLRGVGQSSWGPAVFAVTDDAERAEAAAERIRERFGMRGAEVFVTRGRNCGAVVKNV
jgi:beta-ribofuranosylaminobenzene 5'-phosphate synthase